MTAADASAGARPAATARRVPLRAAAPLAAWTPWLAAAGVVVCAGAVVIAASGARSDAAFGRGLRNMRDRIEAIDGTLVVDALLGHGTRISGAVGLSPNR